MRGTRCVCVRPASCLSLVSAWNDRCARSLTGEAPMEDELAWRRSVNSADAVPHQHRTQRVSVERVLGLGRRHMVFAHGLRTLAVRVLPLRIGGRARVTPVATGQPPLSLAPLAVNGVVHAAISGWYAGRMREVLLGQAPASRDVADRANGLVDAARPMPTSRINKHLKYGTRIDIVT